MRGPKSFLSMRIAGLHNEKPIASVAGNIYIYISGVQEF